MAKATRQLWRQAGQCDALDRNAPPAPRLSRERIEWVVAGGHAPVVSTDWSLMHGKRPPLALFAALLTACALLAMPITALAEDEPPAEVPVYRMYNTKSSEHLYTTVRAEYEACGTGRYADWRQEGIGWYAPETSSTPVYRLYNPVLGDHHYTASKGERETLIENEGWRDEGIAFWSDDAHGVMLYRLYNGSLKRGQHHYTTSDGERQILRDGGRWRAEGIAWYGLRAGEPL